MQSPGSLLFIFLVTAVLQTSVTAAETKSDVVITLQASKEELFVGEPFELEVTVQRCNTVERVEPLFVEPQIEHIWVKRVYKPVQAEENNCSVTKRRYVVSAQQSGLLNIPAVEVKVAYDEDQRDAWGNLTTERYWESHYTNTLEINAKSLPGDITVAGEFVIALEVQSREVAANRALKAELIVEGVGNFEDLSVVIPKISGVDIFVTEPELEQVGSENQERWHQKLTFVGERDFTILPIALEYFDLSDESLKTVQTEIIPIHVTGSKREALPKTEDVQRKGMTVWYILGSMIVIVLLMVLWKKYFPERRGKVKVSYRDHKAVLRLLLAHKEDEGVHEIIEKLEASLYEGKKTVIDQKELKRVLKKYQ